MTPPTDGANIRLITVSGPRGSGKGTIVEALIRAIPGLRRVVPHTTRPARASEVDGREYHFVSPHEFDSLRLAGRFVWWSRIGPTQLAGTSYDELTPGHHGSVLDVLPSGALVLRQKLSDSGGQIFLIAVHASRAERARRIAKRQPDLSSSEIEQLLNDDPAWPDLRDYHAFDLLISNVTPNPSDACSLAISACRAFLTE